MFLLLDPSIKNLIRLALFDEQTIKHYECPGRNRELLESIDFFLTQERVAKSSLLGIMIVVGEGSFTSTRITAVIANVFGYVQIIPLLPITKEQIGDPRRLIPQLLQQQSHQYISATYSREPNIGT